MDSGQLKITPDHRTSLIVDPPDGRIPPLVPLSPEREKAKKEREVALARFNQGMPDSFMDATLPVRCIIRTDSPPYLPLVYNNDFQIFQSPGYVVNLKVIVVDEGQVGRRVGPNNTAYRQGSVQDRK